MTTDVLIRVEGLEKHFGTSIHALNGVDAEIRRMAERNAREEAERAVGDAERISKTLELLGKFMGLEQPPGARKRDGLLRRIPRSGGGGRRVLLRRTVSRQQGQSAASASGI